jgi:presenilin-like A22 family membrane protease
MKHTLKITVALILFFLMAQFAGLLVINHYIDHKKTVESKEIVMKPLPYGLERPEVENRSYSFVYITISIFIGTIIVLLLAKFNRPMIWKTWFFLTVWLTLSISFAAFVNSAIAAATGLLLALLKIYKPDLIIQNISEIFIYGGLAAIFVPMLNVFAAFMLLIVISVYDYLSVYKTKHMISLAKFQSKTKVFAGLLIPYGKGKINSKEIIKPGLKKIPKKTEARRTAVLGGGDIGFTLIFAGVVMQGLMLKETIFIGFLKALIIPLIASLALAFLLVKGQENKFYPAMPILSAGCFLGYLVILTI